MIRVISSDGFKIIQNRSAEVSSVVRQIAILWKFFLWYAGMAFAEVFLHLHRMVGYGYFEKNIGNRVLKVGDEMMLDVVGSWSTEETCFSNATAARTVFILFFNGHMELNSFIWFLYFVTFNLSGTRSPFRIIIYVDIYHFKNSFSLYDFSRKINSPLLFVQRPWIRFNVRSIPHS